jgi:transcriptional regulator with XRE-family HTH domain
MAEEQPVAQPVPPAEIKRQRLALNLRQEDLAAIFGVTRNTVARWERGEVQPDAPGMLRLALEALRLRHAFGPDSELSRFIAEAEAKIDRALARVRERQRYSPALKHLHLPPREAKTRP